MLKKEETILKEILWGERPVHHLSFVKISHSETPDGHEIENPRHLNVVGGPADVARGLLRYRQEPEKMKSWARLVWNNPDLFSIVLDPEGENSVLEKGLLEAIKGQALSEETLTRAETLVPTFPKKRFLGEGGSI